MRIRREEQFLLKGRKTKVVAENFDRIENCPNGEIPERQCVIRNGDVNNVMRGITG